MKSKIPYLIITILVVFITFTLGKNLISNSTSSQFKNEKTPETIDAWKAKWNSELSTYCQSDVFNTVAPEFQRAVSLVLQRYSENENTGNTLSIIRANQSCLDIRYANSVSELPGADGVFLFSSENSGPKGLKILVNPEYKVQDDVATALLLSHELTHAEQFILKDVSSRVALECNNEASQTFCSELQSMKSLGFYMDESSEACVRHETQAYLNQNVFYSVLKDVEKDNILLRANKSFPHKQIYLFMVLLRSFGNLKANVLLKQLKM